MDNCFYFTIFVNSKPIDEKRHVCGKTECVSPFIKLNLRI